MWNSPFFCRREVAVSHTACAKVNWSAHARLSCTPCVKQLLCARKTSTKKRISHTPFKNSYFRSKCEKVILSSWGQTSPQGLNHFLTRVSNTIFWYDVYKAWFSACFFIRACAVSTLRTECNKVLFDTCAKDDSTLVWLSLTLRSGGKSQTRARINTSALLY